MCRCLRRGCINLLDGILRHGFNSNVHLACHIMASGRRELARSIRTSPTSVSRTRHGELTRRPRARTGPTRPRRPRSVSARLSPGLAFGGCVRNSDGGLPHSIKLSVTRRPGAARFGPVFVCNPSNDKGARLIGTVNLGAGRVCPRGHILCIDTHLFRARCASTILRGTDGSFVGFCRSVSILVISSIRS